MATGRRLTPVCWSDDETIALINAYRKKWYSLRRSNLRAPDWQDITDAVAVRCPVGLPPKTFVQCRRKMEKLRQRYSAELQRIDNPNPKNKKKLLYKYSSSWIYFKLMDSLESGVDCSDPSVDLMGPRMDMNSKDDFISLHSNENGIKESDPGPLLNQRAGSEVRNKVPDTISDNVVSSLDEPSKCRSGKNGPSGMYGGGVKKKGEGEGMEGRDGDVMGEMMSAIRRLGDRFVKMERVTMDMTRELEYMRVKMERERTEMVLETQHKVLNLVVTTIVEKYKKVKRMGVTEFET